MRICAWSRAAVAAIVLAFSLAFGLSVAIQPAPVLAAQNPALPVIHIDNGPNSAEAEKILVVKKA